MDKFNGHIDGIGYNVDWVADHTEEEFIAENKHHFDGKKGGTEKLRADYHLIKKSLKAQAEAEGTQDEMLTSETSSAVNLVDNPPTIPVKIETAPIVEPMAGLPTKEKAAAKKPPTK